jgi:hypothetical protein
MATKPKDNPFDTADDPAIAEMDARAKLQEAFGGILTRLSTLADKRVQDRSMIEQRWLMDLRQYHGRFDEKTEEALRQTPEKSRAIINMTRPKTKAWAARLSDLLFPADDKNWGISPTPVPELSEKAKQAAADAEAKHAEAARMVDIHNRDVAAGTQTMPQGQALAAAAELGAQALDLEQAEMDAQAIMDTAKRCSENMAREMDDQLTQCQYPRHSRRLIDDLCKLGSGVMKGPMNGKAAQRWKKVAQALNNGSSAEVYRLAPVTDGNAPIYLRVDPWSFFPDSNATDMDSSESELERHLPNRTQLKRMAKLLDFDPDAVAELCRGGPGFGVGQDLQYLAQLRTITDEGNAVTDRYVLWEYHGPLECDEVETILTVTQGPEKAQAWREDYSELDEVRVIVFFCDGRLLKIEPDWLLDTNETLYSVVSFEKSETSVLGGYGVPAMMRDPARAVAAAWRMLLDNAGLSVGPQVVIDKSRVTPENGSWKMEPRKVWLKSGDDINTDAKPFEVFDIPSNTDELVKVIELALKFIDETTSLPLIAQGEQGAHITQTAGGMSMLMNSANVIFRNVVKNYDDDMTTPNIRRLYDWNMQFNSKEEIKGDMQVEARGTSALLVRELQSANLMVMTERWSSHPILSLALKVYDTMRMTVQSMSINPDDVLGTRDDFENKLKEQAQNAPQDPRIAAAQIDAASRKDQNAANIEIANLRLKSSILDVQARTGETREKIMADLQKNKDNIDHKERMKSVDIAVEDNRAAEARAEGQPADEATGTGVG